MTLIAAAVCPWLEPLPEFGFTVVADLRITGGNPPIYDRGAKIFPLGKYGLVAYSGYLASALPAIRRLRKYFQKNPRPEYIQSTVDALQYCLRDGERVAKSRARTPFDRLIAGDYEAVVAFITPQGLPRYAIYGGKPRQFYMHSVPRGPVLLGSGVEQHQAYMQAVQELIDSESGSIDPVTGFGFYLALALHKTFILEARNPTVGGGVNFVTLDAERGYKRHEMRLVKDGAVPGSHDITDLSPADLTVLPV